MSPTIVLMETSVYVPFGSSPVALDEPTPRGPLGFPPRVLTDPTGYVPRTPSPLVFGEPPVRTPQL